jgi:hypothetical protein
MNEVPTVRKIIATSETIHVPRLIAVLLLGVVVTDQACAGELKSPLTRLDLKDGDGIVFSATALPISAFIPSTSRTIFIPVFRTCGSGCTTPGSAGMSPGRP